MKTDTQIDVPQILTKLGLCGTVQPSIDGLRALYRAWCLAVPFDNMRKMRALLGNSNAILPGATPQEFFADLIATGTGGTCWAHGGALHGLLSACGFDARRATATMFDFGEATHATTIVRFSDDSNWIVDNSFLTMEPLRIDRSSPTLLNDPTHYGEVEIDGDELYVHGHAPPLPGIFFRLLERNVSMDTYERRYEASRSASIFNDRLHVRKNFEDRILVLRGQFRVTRSAQGVETQQIGAKEIQSTLIDEIGIDSAYVEEWCDSGALDATLRAEAGPTREIPVRIPPSRR